MHFHRVPGRVQGGSFLLAVAILVFWVLDAGLRAGVALWNVAGARAATRVAVDDRLGVGPAGRPARETLSMCLGHGGGEVEDTPQPPTWHAKCRRLVPGTRGMSR